MEQILTFSSQCLVGLNHKVWIVTRRSLINHFSFFIYEHPSISPFLFFFYFLPLPQLTRINVVFLDISTVFLSCSFPAIFFSSFLVLSLPKISLPCCITQVSLVGSLPPCSSMLGVVTYFPCATHSFPVRLRCASHPTTAEWRCTQEGTGVQLDAQREISLGSKESTEPSRSEEARAASLYSNFRTHEMTYIF